MVKGRIVKWKGKFMEQYKEILAKVKLFEDIDWDELKHLLVCLQYKVKKYEKNMYIVQEGEEIHYPGIILSGKVEITKESLAGNKSILTFLQVAELFGEVMVCTSKKKSLVNVVATENTEVLYINFNKIINSCSNNCNFHTKLISNMLKLISEKNVALNLKMDYLLIKNMREKLATYLFYKYKENKSLSFNININRNELAHYLNVSRSSMCRELSRMKDEGIIDYYKDSFKILNLELLRENKE